MREYVLKRMLIAGKKTWMSLILTFDRENTLTVVNFDRLREEDILPEQRMRLEVEAKRIRKQEVERALEERGRIGRNELCPCGSGKKFKRCCGRR